MSHDSQRDFPIVSQLTNNTVLSADTAPHMCGSGSRRVPMREMDSLCLPHCTHSIQGDCFYSFRTQMSGGIHAWSEMNKETPNVTKNIQSETLLPSSEIADNFSQTANSTSCTSIRRSINEDCLRYAEARSPNVLKRNLLRTLGTPVFCTLMNAKMNVKHYNVRLCHHKSSSKDLSLKLRRCVSDQSNSSTNVSNTHQNETTEAQLTHTDAQGRASMVDVGGKNPTRRTATASATVILGPIAFQLLRDNQLAKGDALAVAQLSGIMASKQTSALIPLCHPLPLDHVSVTFHLDELQDAAVITATCRTTGRTGVEMEALTAVSVAALTVYDMCKAVSHDIVITDVQLVSKTGGKRDFHRHSRPPPSTRSPHEEN
ncbi:molybdenum cofactor biosynthesis protein 1 isoform 2-T2 [Tautogolabrus adspersus]